MENIWGFWCLIGCPITSFSVALPIPAEDKCLTTRFEAYKNIPFDFFSDRHHAWPIYTTIKFRNLQWKIISFFIFIGNANSFWACPHHNSSPIQARITKLGPEVQNTLVEIPIVLGAIDLGLQGQIWPKESNFLASPLLEIHNHHITTRLPWVPRLLHRPDCFMVCILCMHLYT